MREPSEELEIVANPDRLRQVLINVFSNAVKYNQSAKPEIEVRLDQRGGSVLGRYPGQRRRCFPRGRSRGVRKVCPAVSRAGKDKGAGLGLPISQAIMKAMEGDLTLEFDPDGTSFFRLHLKAV